MTTFTNPVQTYALPLHAEPYGTEIPCPVFDMGALGGTAPAITLFVLDYAACFFRLDRQAVARDSDLVRDIAQEYHAKHGGMGAGTFRIIRQSGQDQQAARPRLSERDLTLWMFIKCLFEAMGLHFDAAANVRVLESSNLGELADAITAIFAREGRLAALE